MSKFFNLEKLLSYGGTFNFAIGARSAGKTFAAKEWILHDFLKNGNQGAYIRRNEDEISAVYQTLWDDVIELKFPEYEVKTMRRVVYIRKKKPKDVIDDRTWKKRGNPWEPFCYLMSLNRSQDYKSGSYPKVTKVVFDELIIENQRRRYITGEVDLFVSLIHTIGRQRKIKVVCLSNAASTNNPYFHYWGINIEDVPKSGILKKHNGTVIVDFMKGQKVTLDGGFLEAAGERFKDYAVDNKFRDGSKDMILPKVRNKEIRYNLLDSTGEGIGVYSAIHNKERIFWIGDQNLHGVNYSADPIRVIEGAPYNKKLVSQIKQIIQGRYCYFKTISIRERAIQFAIRSNW